MPRTQQTRQRLIFLTVLFAALTSFPFLGLVNRPLLIAGVPLLYVYIFACWLLLIVLLLLTARGRRIKNGEGL